MLRLRIAKGDARLAKLRARQSQGCLEVRQGGQQTNFAMKVRFRIGQLCMVSLQTLLAFAQRLEAGSRLRMLLLGFGERRARIVGFHVRVPQGLARRTLSAVGGFTRGLRIVPLATQVVEMALDRGQCSLKVRETVALLEPDGRRGRRLGRCREPVPAPQVALARDEALAWQQLRLCREAGGAVNDANLRKAAGEGAWRLHDAGQNLRAIRKAGQGGAVVQRTPVDRRRVIERYVEVIAKRRAKSGLEARRHLEEVNDRRKAFRYAGRQRFTQRAHFRLEALKFAFGRVNGLATQAFNVACSLQIVFCICMGRAARLGRRRAIRNALLGMLDEGQCVGFAREAFDLALHVVEFEAKPRRRLLSGLDAPFEFAAHRLRFGEFSRAPVTVGFCRTHESLSRIQCFERDRCRLGFTK